MNKAQKIIWSGYIILFIPCLLFEAEDSFFLYLLLGWLPALILSFIWKDKKMIN